MEIKKQVNLKVALAIVGMLFFVIGFALGINGLLIPFLKKAFDLSSTQSYLVLTATFSAFVIFGYPSGMLIKSIGYKKSMAVAFLFFAIGLFLFIPSASNESFVLFIVASFISGMGNTLLQAAVNPYVTICGPIDSAARRLCLMGILNKSGWAIAPIFLSLFLDVSSESVILSQMKAPFYIIVGIFIVLGIFTLVAPLPEVKAEGEDEIMETEETTESAEVRKFVAEKSSVLHFPHLLLGALALFLYVGVETIALATPVDFATTTGLSNPEIYTSYTVVAMVIGYILGVILIPRIISQRQALIVCAASGIIFSLASIFVSPDIAIYFIALMGLSNSLMWGAIWPLAMSYLGKYTKNGASLLVMAIVGGAILPLVFGYLKDKLGIQQAYWVCVPFFVYSLYYALAGYKAGLSNLLEKINKA